MRDLGIDEQRAFLVRKRSRFESGRGLQSGPAYSPGRFCLQSDAGYPLPACEIGLAAEAALCRPWVATPGQHLVIDWAKITAGLPQGNHAGAVGRVSLWAKRTNQYRL